MQTLWNYDKAIGHLVDVPAFIEQDITASDVAAIIHGGCASGAYMPAVTYHTARETMNEHGDDVLQFIEDCYGETPQPPEGESWAGIACFYLSCAVELWASGIEDELTEAIEDEAEEAAQAEEPAQAGASFWAAAVAYHAQAETDEVEAV